MGEGEKGVDDGGVRIGRIVTQKWKFEGENEKKLGRDDGAGLDASG